MYHSDGCLFKRVVERRAGRKGKRLFTGNNKCGQSWGTNSRPLQKGNLLGEGTGEEEGLILETRPTPLHPRKGQS
jgi:hypothetical protein